MDQMQAPRETLEAKLAFLRKEHALAVDPEQKFSIGERIKETLAKLTAPTTLLPQRIAPSRLPRGAKQLFGREHELEALDALWASGGPNVVTLVAWGGIGKSALIAAWVAKIAEWGFHGADYFDWSFCSQGARDDGAASADVFVNAALRHFGAGDLANSPASPWAKGACLADLVAERRTLLVLDGLEPIQHPPGPLAGQLKDPAITALLKGLAARNPGLCVVTTRESVADLAAFQQTTAPEWALERLPSPAAEEMLRELGVKGPTRELQALIREVDGHALTLSLLGNYLRRAHGGDVRRRDRVDLEKADTSTFAGHAFRAMAAYVTWLQGGGEAGQRQLAVLRLTGLFDRAASYGCIEALRAPPAIVGLTEPFQGLTGEEWNEALVNLQEAGLVSISDAGPEGSGLWEEGASFDAHPLVREYFGRELRQRDDTGWRAGHGRIYEHLRDTTDQEPATLEGLQPLYQAVAHGCKAGRQQEACVEVYERRILRGTGPNGVYPLHQLGAFSADLGAVSNFFEEPWSRPSLGLTEEYQAWLLNEAAYRLRALGRLREAVEPLRAALGIATHQENWGTAAIRASNLSDLAETLGGLQEAVEAGAHSVEFADRTTDRFLRLVTRARLANAQFHIGRREQAGALYRKAEPILQTEQLAFPQLYSLLGFRYREFLLASTEQNAWYQSGEEEHPPLLALCSQVEDLAAKAILIAEQNQWLLVSALDHLTLGRVRLYRALLMGGDPEKAEPEISRAVEGLRQSGSVYHIPRGLLTRAQLRWHKGETPGACADLDEAWDIATRGPMPLYQADVLLYRARFFRDRKSLSAARVLIEKHSYWRRRGELEDAERAAGSWEQ